MRIFKECFKIYNIFLKLNKNNLIKLITLTVVSQLFKIFFYWSEICFIINVKHFLRKLNNTKTNNLHIFPYICCRNLNHLLTISVQIGFSKSVFWNFCFGASSKLQEILWLSEFLFLKLFYKIFTILSLCKKKCFISVTEPFYIIL